MASAATTCRSSSAMRVKRNGYSSMHACTYSDIALAKSASTAGVEADVGELEFGWEQVPTPVLCVGRREPPLAVSAE